MIGNDGLTPGVLAEIERALKSHELIKIRVHGDDRGARLEWLDRICEFTTAAPVQHIGKLLTIYRSNLELQARPVAPAERRKAADRTTRTNDRSSKGWKEPGSASRSRRPAATGTGKGKVAGGNFQRPPRPTTHSRRGGPSTPRNMGDDPVSPRAPRRRQG